jgi:hypothetical protein
MGAILSSEIITVQLTVFDTMVLANTTKHLRKLREFHPRNIVSEVMDRVSAACIASLDSEGLYQDAEGAWHDRNEG